jgi:hypothetical protein
LAELLMDRSGAPEWSPEHRSFNCLSMPKEHPAPLAYAASVAVVLAHFQIGDQVADSRWRWHWKAIQRFFSPAYRKAAADLRASGFALDEMAAILKTQTDREAAAVSLTGVAEPTARAAEMVFSHGNPELASIGRRFGYLVYVLDALEDRARDSRRGDFNFLLKHPEVDGRREILSAVESLEKDLPAHLAARLRMNVEERLGMRPRVVHGLCQKSARERWRSATAFAQSIREKERAGFLKGAAVLASVSILAFLVPHHIKSAESWHQCLGLTMNLMTVGAIFATVHIPNPGDPAKKSGCWSSCCSSGCCDSCDCGDCCQCGECCSC